MNGRTEPPLTDQDKIKGMHIVFCAETGNQLRLTMPYMDDWARWMANGWTADDLRVTIRYIRKTFYRKDKPEVARCMTHFDKLIRPKYTEGGHRDWLYFEQLLSDARADQRNSRPAPTQRTAVLKAVGRTEEAPRSEVRQAGTVAQQIISEGWEKLKKEANL